MRDVLIATAILAAGTYAAFSYDPAPVEISLASVASEDVTSLSPVGDGGSTDVVAMVDDAGSVVMPLPHPWRHVPIPMAKPASGDVLSQTSVARSPLQRVDVVNAGLIEIDGTRFGLFGVDAPSVNQTCRSRSSGLWACGTDARKAVAVFLEGREVACTPVAAAVADAPVLSRCDVDGVDLNAWVVSSGWALADTAIDDRLVAAQGLARSGKTGLWTGWFEAPAEWRARNEEGVRVASRSENRA